MPAVLAARGSLQRYGDTIFNLVRELCHKVPSVGPEDADRRMHFFDILGYCMVIYDMPFGRRMHTAVLIAAASAVWLSRGRPLLGLLSGAAAGALQVLAGVGMVWFSRPMLVVPLLGGPALFTCLWWHGQVAQAHPAGEVKVAALLVPSFFLLLATGLGSPIAYLPLLWVLGPLLLAWPLAELVGEQRSSLLPWAWLAGLLLPWIATLQLLMVVLDVFVPLTGRSGDAVPGAVIIGALFGLVIGLISAPSAPLLLSLIPSSQCHFAQKRLVGCAVLAVVAAMVASPLPYDEAHPKRIFLQHMNQQFYLAKLEEAAPGTEVAALSLSIPVRNSSSVLATGFDYNCLAPVGGFDFFDGASHRADKFLRTDWPVVYAQLPYIFPILKMVSPKCMALLDAPPPELPPGHSPLRPELTVETRPNGVKRLHVKLVTSGSLMAAAIPAAGLLSWSLGDLPVARSDCDCHWVLHGSGGQPEPRVREWTFWMDIDPQVFHAQSQDNNNSNNKGYAIEVYSHWIEGSTAELRRMMAQVPDFVSPVAWYSMWLSLQVQW
ncbi:unnamed protein product [Polarella glacialis]|uniref:Uncharacterized protein n=1 Tax=Polarella glacialis TaxID=89957 RepID=A0A813LWL2_POLGL|nr:unnamed protein product [Polarella glacialis]